MRGIKVIAFDADDTLWDCQGYFENVEEHLYSLIRPFCENPKQELFDTESANMEDLGYGCKAFTISIIETALRVGGNDITSTELSDLLKDCKRLLHLPATPLPEVESTLKTLHDSIDTRLVVFTKGELQDQENKLKRYIPFHITWQLEHFDDIDHERLIKIQHFSEILKYLL